MNLANPNYTDLIIIEKGRVFIDVAYCGCGCGCLYCYVPTAAQPQRLASYEDLTKAINSLIDRDAVNGRIISFCPNTEPLKSEESQERVLFLIEKLKEYQYYFQISTKEFITNHFLQRLNDLADDNNIYINISIPYIDAQGIEPNAADVAKRVSNLERIRNFPNLKSGLYIKPFTDNALMNVKKYIEIINQTHPDYVCVGVQFDENVLQPCTTLYHSETALSVIAKQSPMLERFIAKMGAVDSTIVYSSICPIIRAADIPCSLELWKYNKIICANCTRLVEEIHEEHRRAEYSNKA